MNLGKNYSTVKELESFLVELFIGIKLFLFLLIISDAGIIVYLYALPITGDTLMMKAADWKDPNDLISGKQRKRKLAQNSESWLLIFRQRFRVNKTRRLSNQKRKMEWKSLTLRAKDANNNWDGGNFLPELKKGGRDDTKHHLSQSRSLSGDDL